MAHEGQITVTLPLPSRALHAHTKGHWRTKAGPTQAAREMAAHSARQLRPPVPFEAVTVSLCFFWPDNRRRDTLNSVQGIKPYIDGLIDAGLMADDRWQVMSIGRIVSSIDRDNPRVDITVAPSTIDV